MKIAHMHPNANYVFILMDEVFLRHGLGLDQPSGTILGFNDDGNIRTKELVSPALYIMMSGTFVKWKYPIGYCLSKTIMKAKEIVSIVKRSIEVIEAENFKVLGITTDQGANFLRAFKLLSTLDNHFKISLNTKDYFIIRDPPHLLKRTRTHLANGDVILPDGKGNASWAHLRKLYQLDQMSSMRIVPKLSDKHIEDLKGANQMKVIFAAQMVSNTVSAALNYHVASGSIKAAAYATSTFLKNFNDFFDIFNSSSHREKTPLRRPIYLYAIKWDKILK